MKQRNKKGRWMKKLTAIVAAFCMLAGVVPSGFELVAPLQVEAAVTIQGNGTGGIWIDINGYPYNSMNYNGIAYGPQGCTWFAAARATQLTGNTVTIWSGSAWWNYHRNYWGTGNTTSTRVTKAPAMLCWGNHVAVLEKVVGTTAYISEGGTAYANASNGYCRIYTCDVSQIGAQNSNYLGAIYLPGASEPVQPTYDPITEPVISTNLPSYIAGETVKFTWPKSSANSNFKEYWVVVHNLTTDKQLCSQSTTPYVYGSYNANSFSIPLNEPGKYRLTVYAVPYDEARKKACSLDITVQNQKYGASVQPYASMIYNGHLYELYEDRASVRNADETAYRKGGHLVNITSSGEQSAVMKLINTGSGWHYKEIGWYIGLTDRNKEGTWKWLNGEAFSYQNWNSGEPNNSGGDGAENYACIISGGKWNDVSGNGAYPYIVEYDTINYSKFSPAKTMTYDFDKGKIVYRLYDNRVTVADAQQIAKAKGEVLTSITSSTEQSRINTLLGYSSKKSENGMYWYIGLTDAEKEGTWKWMNGDTYSYKYWNTGEPNNNDGGKAENYVVLKPNGTWNDVTGQNYYGFVTKKIIYNDLTVPTITTNREKYITNEVANISWAKTTEKTDFSNYWVVVTNVDTGEVIYNGNADSANNVHKNSLDIRLPKAGKYKIETVSCSISDNAARQKYATKTVIVEDMSNGENLTPSGTYEYNDHRYEVYDTRLDFMTARKVAKSKGGYLATITSQEEMNAIIELLKSSTTNQFETGWFIGLTDIAEEGNWKWDTGETFSYSNWGDGEPNNANDDEDCVAIFNKDTGKWNDVWTHDCYHAFIVEYNKNVVGDVNGDKNITAEDALAILKHVVGLETLTGDALTCADVNAENGVTAEDALDVLKKVVGLIDKFTAEM